MGHRLSKIYTRTGDDGSTGLADGARLSKADRRFEAMGDLDELNCQLGVLQCLVEDAAIHERLLDIQHVLFDAGGELSLPGVSLLDEGPTRWLEMQIDSYNASLPPLKEFILPGGTAAAAACHLARAICRRAERHLVALSAGESVNPHTREFLNRLSDFLFVLARTLARANGEREVLWQKNRLADRSGGEG